MAVEMTPAVPMQEQWQQAALPPSPTHSTAHAAGKPPPGHGGRAGSKAIPGGLSRQHSSHPEQAHDIREVAKAKHSDDIILVQRGGQQRNHLLQGSNTVAATQLLAAGEWRARVQHSHKATAAAGTKRGDGTVGPTCRSALFSVMAPRGFKACIIATTRIA